MAGASSYGVFLKTFDRETRSIAQEGLEDKQKSPLAFLKTLEEKGKPVEVQQLLKISDLGVLELAETLKSMQRSGLVTVTQQGGQEVVGLTPEGAHLAASLP